VQSTLIQVMLSCPPGGLGRSAGGGARGFRSGREAGGSGRPWASPRS